MVPMIVSGVYTSAKSAYPQVVLKQRDGTLGRLYEYWIQGIDPPESKPRRWSVLHDVLGVDAFAAKP